METVKVDMQKLQLLNDRIAQTIEALNQLRLTVHGIQQSPSPIPTWGPGVGSGYGGYGAYSPYAGYSPMAFAQPTFGQPAFVPPFTVPYVPGVQHTSPATTGWSTPFMGNGISHSTWDPQWTTRAARWPVAPTYPVTIY